MPYKWSGIDNYEFPIEEIPIVELVKSDFRVVAKNFKAIIRSDTNEVLGIVSKRYRVVHHSTVVSKFSSVLGEPKFVKIVQNGAKMFAYWNITNEVIHKDDVELGLLATNGYDGKMGVNVKLFGIVLTCENGLIDPMLLGSLKIIHRGFGILTRIDKVVRRIEVAIDRWKTILHNFTKHTMTREELEDIISHLKFSKSQKYKILYRLGYKEEFTLWEGFNAITYLITNIMKRKIDSKISLLSKTYRAFINAYPEVYDISAIPTPAPALA